MFKFKKIDTESSRYVKIRDFISNVCGLGSSLALECMSVPMVMGVFREHKALRLLCYAGIVPIATWVDLFSKGTTEAIIDNYAELYNILVDKYQDDEEDVPYVSYTVGPEVEICHKYEGLDIPGKDATPEEEKKFVDDVILKTTAFEFATEESAKEFAASIFSALQLFGFLELTSVFKWLKVDLPTEVRDILYKYGWTKDDMGSISVEKTKEHTWIVDVFNYHDISEIYNILYKGDKGDE